MPTINSGKMNLNLNIKATYDEDFANLIQNLTQSPPSVEWLVLNGAGSGKANDLYNAEETSVSQVSPTVLNFADASLLNPGNATISWLFMRGFVISIPATETEGIVIGGGANPIFATLPKIWPGGGAAIIYLAGWTVAAAATENLQLDGTGNTGAVKVNLAILGEK